MLSHFWGALDAQPHSLPKEDYPFKKKTDNFTLLSSQPIFESENALISLHGPLFKNLLSKEDYSHFNQDPQRMGHIIEDLFNQKGPDFYQDLDGLHFIIFYQKKKGVLHLFNNRYQCTSGYYTSGQVPFIFSNDILKIKNSLEPKEVTPHFGAIRSFISNGFTSPDQTQISSIKKFLPCFRLQREDNESTLFHHADTEYSFERKPFSDLESKLDDYENLYRSGLENWKNATQTKTCGSLLSGGHDTSFAFIQGSKVFDKPLHGFTVTFPGWAWDEEAFAKNICEKFNGHFHPIPFEPEDLDYIVSMVRANQEPVVGSSLPLHKLSLEAREHVDGMLGGDGGDTLWGEYFPVAEYHRYIKNIPRGLRKSALKMAQAGVKLTDWERFWELSHVAALFTEDDYYHQFMTKLCTYRHFSFDFQKKLFKKEIFNTPLPSAAYEVPFTKDGFQDQLISGKLYNAFYPYQSFSTYRSVEHFNTPFYLPTINKEVIDFINSLPYEWINGGTTLHRLTNNKTINRRFHKMALSRYLKREEIYNRSFDIPWYKILKPRPKVLSALLTRLKNRGWYNEEFLDSLFKEFENQEAKDYELLELKHHGYRIFTLLSLEVWATEFLDGRESDDFDRKINLEDYLLS